MAEKADFQRRRFFTITEFLHEALREAVQQGELARNVADAVKPPSAEDKEVEPLDEAPCAWHMEIATGTRLYLPILLTICTGLRRGELLALTWDDVDLDAGWLWVRRALEETCQGVRFKAPKSKKGRRSVTLPAIAIEALREHQRHQQERKELLGEAYHDERLICCLEDGSLWRPSAFTSSYFSLLARRKFPRVSFHNLRHSHASQLLRAGISPKVISERLGHSKVGFTLHTYAHLLPGMQEEAASRIDSVLRAAMEKRAYRA